jgi:RNA polymerase sigma-70 factor (ECF subfamily)
LKIAEVTPALVAKAAEGDSTSIRQLVALSTPIVHVRVSRMLFRFRARAGRRDLDQELDDIAQEVFAELFEERARVLRSWTPDRGLSFANFVGLVADRVAINVLRSGRRNPWTEEPVEADALDGATEASLGPELRAASREFVEALLERLRGAVSPRGYEMFWVLFVEEKSVETVSAELAMQPDAIYAWRSRLMKTVKKLAQELHDERASEGRLPARRPSVEKTEKLEKTEKTLGTDETTGETGP